MNKGDRHEELRGIGRAKGRNELLWMALDVATGPGGLGKGAFMKLIKWSDERLIEWIIEREVSND